MTPEQEKELLDLEAQVIRLRMLNNQYARHLNKTKPKSWHQNALMPYLGQVSPETWKAFVTPNTLHNKVLMVLVTALLAFIKKKRS